MDALHHMLEGFRVLGAPVNLLSCFVGVVIGTLIGVLPGIGPVATMAILLPFTFSLTPVSAIIMLAGIYYGAQYGGSTTSVLVNIPGEVGSIITCLDGYQMGKQGRAGPALGISAIGSFVGGTLGVIGLTLLCPPLAQVALNFGPPELFALILFGLMMVSSLGGDSLLKALLMTAVGLFVSLIGKESFTGFSRFTFGSITLSDGLGLVPVSMGMFGISEILCNVEVMAKQRVFRTDIQTLFAWRDWIACRWAVLRGTLVGFFLGILPGAGVVMTTFFAYWLEKRVSKHPEKFGAGVIEGVAAPETANNAATAGSMIPLLALGVPATPTMAMLMGALIIQGVQPGPLFISQYPDLFWGVIASMYIGNIMLLILNLPLIGIWVRILKIPYTLLFPLITLFCIVGVYSLNNNVYEILIMILFGLFGYILRKFEYPLATFLLGMVLGPMMETSFRQSLGIGRGNLTIFFQRTFSAVLLISVGIVFLISFYLSIKRKRKPLEEGTS
jgi:putative tricarboxylic transport membrane protein